MTRTPAPGRTEVTIKDIAARLAISHATVSRALNDHPATSQRTKQRVRETAEALGYIRNTLARGLSGAASQLIGFVAPDIRSDFYANVTAAIADRCAVAGMQVMVSVSDDDPELEYERLLALRQARVGGVILNPTAGMLPKSVALLAGLPTVQLVRTCRLLEKPWVGIDDRVAVKVATDHLLERGHTRIGFIGGHEALTTGHERKVGYQEALAAAGIAYDDALCRLGPPRVSFGAEAALALTALDEPITGLVLGSSQITIGALTALQQKGLRAPDDLSVVGYSDPDWARIWGASGLTTMALPADDIGASAAQMLFRAMAAPSGAATPSGRGGFAFQPQIVERGSVAPIGPWTPPLFELRP